MGNRKKSPWKYALYWWAFPSSVHDKIKRRYSFNYSVKGNSYVQLYSFLFSCFLVFLFSCFLVFWILYSVLLKVASDDESRSTDRNWVFVHLSECGTWCNESPLLRSTIFDRVINAKKRLYKACENNSKYDNFAETLVLSSLKRSRQSFYQGFFSGETL